MKRFVVEDDAGELHIVDLPDLEMDMLPCIRFQNDSENSQYICEFWISSNRKREPGQSYLLD